MSKYKKFICGSDVHGDMQDAKAVAAFFRFVEDFKPHIKVFCGDLWDFRAIRKGASEEERQESIAKDYIAGVQFLKQFQPHHFLLGNHDARLFELAELNKGLASDYAASGVIEIKGIARKMNCNLMQYDKRSVLKIGKARFIHGFFSGASAARQHAQHFGGVFFGHTHTIDNHPIPGLEKRVARGVGCLCSLDMEYAARNPGSLRHAHGWAYGIINEKTGEYYSAQAEEINGKWILPTGFKEI